MDAETRYGRLRILRGIVERGGQLTELERAQLAELKEKVTRTKLRDLSKLPVADMDPKAKKSRRDVLQRKIRSGQALNDLEKAQWFPLNFSYVLGANSYTPSLRRVSCQTHERSQTPVRIYSKTMYDTSSDYGSSTVLAPSITRSTSLTGWRKIPGKHILPSPASSSCSPPSLSTLYPSHRRHRFGENPAS